MRKQWFFGGVFDLIVVFSRKLIYFNGTLISPAAGTNQTVNGQAPFTCTGATGSGNFELIYTSNYIAPGALSSNINVTPEPNSLVLLGTGLASMAGMVFRRRTVT